MRNQKKHARLPKKKLKKASQSKKKYIWLVGIGLLIVVLLGGLFFSISRWPSLGAKGADILRAVIGDKAVAKLETAAFGLQDLIHQAEYKIGLAKPATPWDGSTRINSTAEIIPSASIVGIPFSSIDKPHAKVWAPELLNPLGSLVGEGIWLPYLQDTAGRTVAYRTYLQPDETRPYVVVAVIAFDLSRTHLHLVLGSVEPYSPDSQKRSGLMPESDKKSGVLMAMFNGGFKARHGQFGAMAGGITALPPREGLGTLAIYADGVVRIGEWGSEIVSSPGMTAFRQNGPLVIHQGRVNPQIYNNSPKDWGYTVDDFSPTWRSGIGISADGKVLYYFCGPSLLMEPLARSMQAAEVADAIQLDINNYWTHFVAVRSEGSKLVLEPLFPKMMKENVDRYLFPYTRDFFYVTDTP